MLFQVTNLKRTQRENSATRVPLIKAYKIVRINVRINHTPANTQPMAWRDPIAALIEFGRHTMASRLKKLPNIVQSTINDNI